MKSLASLLLLSLAVAAPALAQEPPPGDGPRGTSGAGGEARYDAVGYAGAAEIGGISAVSGVLPAGSHAEVTALDTGRTIVVAVVAGTPPPGRIAALSADAANALGASGDSTAIRIRAVTPSPQDIVQLRSGGVASFRADAPPALLAALRKMLPAPTRAAVIPAPKPPVARPKPAPVARPQVATAATSGFVVQVAALSSAARAKSVADATGGTVVAGPPVWRVRLGPFSDAASAARARDMAARTGYPGGQIIRIP